VPLLILLFGGLIKWILSGGPAPRRDHFLLGIELSLTSMALAFTGLFEWVRNDVLQPSGSHSDPFVLLLYIVLSFTSLAALLIVMALMRAYVDQYDANEAANQPTISWWRFVGINAAGASPLGIALVSLID
jgi:hypothetical protein